MLVQPPPPMLPSNEIVKLVSVCPSQIVEFDVPSTSLLPMLSLLTAFHKHVFATVALVKHVKIQKMTPTTKVLATFVPPSPHNVLTNYKMT